MNYSTQRLYGQSCPTLVFSNGVGQDVYSGRFVIVTKNHRDEIYSPQLGQVIMVLAVVPGAGYQFLFLRPGNGFFGTAEPEVALGSYFDKDEVFPVDGNDIQLTFGAAIVGFQYLVVAFYKEVFGKPLSQLADVFTFH